MQRFSQLQFEQSKAAMRYSVTGTHYAMSMTRPAIRVISKRQHRTRSTASASWNHTHFCIPIVTMIRSESYRPAVQSAISIAERERYPLPTMSG
jgi:hypothetical protein